MTKTPAQPLTTKTFLNEKTLGIVAGIFGLTLALTIYFGHQAQPKIWLPPNDIAELTNQTKSRQSEFVISEVTLTRSGASNTLKAQVKYTGHEPTNARAFFRLQNTITNRLQGNKFIPLDNLQPGETRPVTITIIGEFDRSDAFELVVEKNNP